MDVDTRLGVRQFCNNARYHRHFQLVKLVGDAVVRHSLHYGITEYHLAIVQCCGVVVEHCLNVCIEQAFYLWQGVDKLQRQFVRQFIHLFLRSEFMAVLTKLHAVGYLLCQ